MLDNAMHFYKIECGQSDRHQSTIYDWMDRYEQLRSGQLIGERLTDAWDVGQWPPPIASTEPQSNLTSSEEQEFHWNQSV